MTQENEKNSVTTTDTENPAVVADVPAVEAAPSETQTSEAFAEGDKFVDRVVHISRVAKVVKGGRRFSFSALVVTGDGRGQVGFALGKANEVPDAIRKGIEKARKKMVQIPMSGRSIPHDVMGKFGAGHVMLKRAAAGTGVIAGGPVRAICEAAGIHDILTKCIGTSNPHNVVRATVEGLLGLVDPKARRAELKTDAAA